MPKKVCPNGHIYDSAIYGEECPLCPKGSASMDHGTLSMDFGIPQQQAAGTQVTPPQVGGAIPGRNNVGQGGDAIGATELRDRPNMGRPVPAQPVGGGTVIRQPKGAPQAAGKGRKLVGFLVTYNRTPQGKAYEIYEGKNYIGRDRSCDISVQDDNQMSSRHMSILYRNVDNKFKYRDEQSSNGTFVNKELSDEGELQNFDIIRLGNTIFIFIAIPQLG